MKSFFTILLFIFFATVAVALIYNFWPETRLAKQVKIDYLLVDKSKKTMKAYSGKNLIKTYPISIGKSPIGHKVFEGDNKTPEGIYTINSRNPNSAYHKNLGVSYPNKTDREKAKQLGKSPGGDIKIHGLPDGILSKFDKFHRFFGWTNGCIMVTNAEVDELYEAVVPNAKIEIRP
ncbi:L,D-transpeptidase family protein [Pedobacter sp. SL55]|uniref:L,D-transpeptidase family protein n=1 Tax=Pedobacter sp. SL55 TaxID=2995161 RepID=UPI00226F8C62|nr:L,D-transpeptidase family protein [Pedobacter sp. SL55]WAC39204.1 L,D-transpeptidase family protein [Pedobacter sp. SL55]